MRPQTNFFQGRIPKTDLRSTGFPFGSHLPFLKPSLLITFLFLCFCIYSGCSTHVIKPHAQGRTPAVQAGDSQNLASPASPAESSFKLPPQTQVEGNKEDSSIINQAIRYLTPSSVGESDFVSRALSGTLNYFGSAVGGILSAYGQWRSRISADHEGRFMGGADYLYPFFDSGQTLFFGQGGISAGHDSRILAHLGLGQRFFPEDEWALGWNAFLDGDLKRDHYRAGVGLELWIHNLKLAGNYYEGIGPWRPSEDYPDWPVFEKAASGWDVRAIGRLPFAPSLALTGGLEKWRGQQAGSFSPDGHNPKLQYSYGLNWSPWPFLTASVSQTRGQGSRTQTNFCLTFNYRPGIPLEDQVIAASPAASRHDFVDRDYTVPLAYKSDGHNMVIIRVVKGPGDGHYIFMVTNGFRQPLANYPVNVTVSNPIVSILDPSTMQPRTDFLTDENGCLEVVFQSPEDATVEATVSAGGSEVTFEVDLDGDGQTNPGHGNPGGSAGTGKLVLSSEEDSVEFGQPQEIVLTITENGLPLTPGETVEIIGGDGWDNLPDTAAVQEDGKIVLEDVVAGGLDGLDIQVKKDDEVSNPVSFTVETEGGVLNLTVRPEVLNLLTPVPLALHVKLNGRDLPAGTAAAIEAGAGLTGIPAAAAVGSGGIINLTRIVAETLEPKKILVKSLELTSNEVTLTVDANGGLGNGNLILTADRDALNLLTPTDLKLAVKLDGQPLPAGVPVEIIAASGLTGIPSSATAEENGQISLSGVTAQVLETLKIQVNALGLTSNEVSLTVDTGSGSLSLSASPESLELLTPADAALTVKFNGNALPAGTLVEIIADSGLDGVPAAAAAAAGGIISLPGVTAQTLGPLNIKVRSYNLTSNQVGLAVTTSSGSLTLSASPESLELLTPTDVALTVKFNGRALPAGTPVDIQADAGLAGVPASTTAGPGGVIDLSDVTAQTLGPLKVRVQSFGLTSNQAGLAVTAGSGSLTLTALPDTLSFLEPTDLTLKVQYNGYDLPVGAQVQILASAGLTGVPGSVTAAAGGIVSLTNVTAQSMGPLNVQVKSLGLTSNQAGLAVSTAGGTLTLSANPAALELLTPTSLNLTVKYNGNDLPAGTQVEIQADSGLVNIPASTTAGSGGVISLPHVMAQNLGPLNVRAVSLGLTSNQVGLDVSTNSGTLTLTADPSALNLLTPTNVTLTVKYNGVSLPAGTAVELLPGPGLAGVAGSGTISPGSRISLSNVSAEALGPLNIQVRSYGLTSNQASFTVTAIGDLTLAANPVTLNLLDPADLDLTVKFNGHNLPQGAAVNISADAGLANVPGSVNAGAGGSVSLSQVAAHTLGPLKIQVRSFGLTSNQVSLTVAAVGNLTLEADPTALDLLTPANLALTVKFNGKTVPGGTQVSIQAGSGLAGVPASSPAGSGGVVSLSNVSAQAAGPLKIQVRSFGLASNQVSLTVNITGSLTLEANPTTLPYLTAASLVLTVKYNGAALPAGISVQLVPGSGLGNIPATPTTASGGLVTAANAEAQAMGPLNIQAKSFGLTSNSVSLTVSVPALAINTSSLPGGKEGSAYSAAVSGSGGVPAYIWSASGLPAGLTMSSSTGAISGTPSANGTFPVTVTLQDTLSAQVQKVLSLAIAAPDLIISTASLPGGAQGSAYSATVAGSGGVPAYTWSAAGLPAGLTMSSAGVISGTPSASGTFTVNVRLSDSAAAVVQKNLSLHVAVSDEDETSYPYGSGTLINSQVLVTDNSHGDPWIDMPNATGLYGVYYKDPVCSTGSGSGQVWGVIRVNNQQISVDALPDRIQSSIDQSVWFEYRCNGAYHSYTDVTVEIYKIKD